MKRKSQAVLKIILILFFIIVLLKLCLIFLWPFFLSFIFVIILEPLVGSFMKLGFDRKSSVAISFIIMLFIIGFIIFYLWGYTYNHLTSLFNKLPEVFKIIGNRIEFINQDSINYDNIINGIEGLISSYRSKIVGTVLSTLNGIIYIIIILLTSFFLSLDLDAILKGVKRLIPIEYFIMLSSVTVKILSIVRIELKLVIFTTAQMVLGLYLLGVEEPLTIGIICGILDLLPIVGPTLIFIPWTAYEFITGNLFLGIGLMLLFILLQVNRQIMHIKYVGDNLKIRPVVSIFALYTGILLFGVWGVILGPFLIILIQELYNNMCEGRKVFRL